MTVFGIATMSLFIAQLNITSKHNTRIEEQIIDLQNKIMNLNTKLNKGCLPKKKIAEKETLVHTGGRGVKKIPFF